MQFIRTLIRVSPIARDERFRVLKSVSLRLKGKKAEEAYAWKWQFRLVIGLLMRLWSLPFTLRKAKGVHTVYYDNVTGPDSIAKRKYFLQKHACPGKDQVGILPIGERSATASMYFSKLSLRKLWVIHRVAWRFLWAAFLGLFQKSRVHWMWKLRTANDVLQQILLHDGEIQQFLFFSYEPNTYFSSFLANRLFPEYQPHIISSNSVFFSNNRYLYHPDLAYHLCSSFQVEESKSYQNLGWMKMKSVDLWGLEEALVLDQVSKTSPTMDIGIFSSAFWARTKGMWRSGKIDEIRSYAYIDHPLYDVFKRILDSVLELQTEMNLKVKVYFHPYEEMLFQKHGIRPPYLDQLDSHGVAYEIGGKTTLENFYEPKVGLSVCSTAVFDHLHHQLPAYYFAGWESPNYTIAAQHLGEYQKYGFYDMEELKRKLRKELAD